MGEDTTSVIYVNIEKWLVMSDFRDPLLRDAVGPVLWCAEMFCLTHCDLLSDKIVVYKHIEHRDIQGHDLDIHESASVPQAPVAVAMES